MMNKCHIQLLSETLDKSAQIAIRLWRSQVGK